MALSFSLHSKAYNSIANRRSPRQDRTRPAIFRWTRLFFPRGHTHAILFFGARAFGDPGTSQRQGSRQRRGRILQRQGLDGLGRPEGILVGQRWGHRRRERQRRLEVQYFPVQQEEIQGLRTLVSGASERRRRQQR